MIAKFRSGLDEKIISDHIISSAEKNIWIGGFSEFLNKYQDSRDILMHRHIQNPLEKEDFQSMSPAALMKYIRNFKKDFFKKHNACLIFALKLPEYSPEKKMFSCILDKNRVDVKKCTCKKTFEDICREIELWKIQSSAGHKDLNRLKELFKKKYESHLSYYIHLYSEKKENFYTKNYLPILNQARKIYNKKSREEDEKLPYIELFIAVLGFVFLSLGLLTTIFSIHKKKK